MQYFHLNRQKHLHSNNKSLPPNLAWYNNYHIVTEIDNTLHDHDGDPNTDEVPKNNVFKISADNIALDDITYIPLTPDQHDPENNEAYFFRGLLQFQMRRRKDLQIARTACKDISKVYFNDYPPALEYVKKNKSFVKGECYQFIRE